MSGFEPRSTDARTDAILPAVTDVGAIRSTLPPSQRVHALDFMRGLFIVLALIQHFAGFVNHWHPAHLAPPDRLAIDDGLHALVWLLTPAGDHLFLFLAAFNLARRRREAFREVFPRKLRFFAVLFGFFLFEPFFVEWNLGHALSFGPLLAWMIILAVLATLHRLAGWRGVAVAFVVHLGFLGLPMEQHNDAVEVWVRAHTGLPSWRYESRLDLFFGTGCAGFLLGWWYHHGQGEERAKMLGSLVAGAVLFLPWALLGEFWTVDRHDIWAHEYDVANSTLGLASIWAANVMALSAALLFEHRVRSLWVPVLNWCGLYSLLIFAMHRAWFARVLAPLRDYVARRWDLPVHNTVWEIGVFIALTLLAAWVVRRTRLLRILEQ